MGSAEVSDSLLLLRRDEVVVEVRVHVSALLGLFFFGICYKGCERETNNEFKNNKNRHQNYMVHQFDYVHGRKRENIFIDDYDDDVRNTELQMLYRLS